MEWGKEKKKKMTYMYHKMVEKALATAIILIFIQSRWEIVVTLNNSAERFHWKQ